MGHIWRPQYFPLSGNSPLFCERCGAKYRASGTEARRAETGTVSVHDGPAPKADAQDGTIPNGEAPK
jgi:hypothetical protein